MKAQNTRRQARNPYTLAARSRIGGALHDRREERGGASNDQRELLDTWLEEREEFEQETE